MTKIIMMTGVAAYLLGFGVYVIIYSSAFWGDDWDYFADKFMQGVGAGLAWPYLLIRYFVEGVPMMLG